MRTRRRSSRRWKGVGSFSVTPAQDRIYSVDAITLRRTNLGEKDRLVTLFTRERGKVSSVAKGARGPKSRLAGLTEPFTNFRGQLSHGQSLQVLTQGEVRNAYLHV